MNCKIQLTAAWDRPYWIRWTDFKKCVDEDDLACRDSWVIQDCYLATWFSYSENGERHFNPPTFCLRNGLASFINGRHRTILLSKHLDILPMALAQTDAESQSILDGIVEREIGLDEVIVLPDLPIERTIARK